MSNDYDLLLNHVSSLTERRQNVTVIYLSVNAALTGAIAFLFKDGQLSSIVSEISVLALLFSGIVASGLWRRLIVQHSVLIGWWYEQLRTVEQEMPDSKKLITKEFQELYQKKEGKKELVGLTRYETLLTWLFTGIYVTFGIALLVAILIRLV